MSAICLSRRTVLRGLGTAIAIPALDAMLPRATRGNPQPARPPVRAAFLYVPNGVHMPDWTPTAPDGKLDTLPPILQPLEQHTAELLVLSGLTLNGGRSLGDGAGDHARSVASFLTGAHPVKTDGADIRNGVSVDQVAAEKIGGQTRFPSLELGCEPSAQAGRCDSGYSCVYTSNISWRTPTSPMAKQINPRAVFDRLFGDGSDVEQRKNRALRDQNRQSILDFASEDARQLRGKLGATDQRKLDEYLHAVRQIELRVSEGDKLRHPEPVPEFPRPAGVPREFAEHVRLMLDLIVLALQSDSTRVVSFMFSNAGSNRSYPEIGVREGHHGLSHHGNNQQKQEKISKINQFHTSLLAYLLKRMKSTSDGDGSLLDHSMVMYGSGISDGNRHHHHDLPVLLAGRGGRTLTTGRHVRYAPETPLTNLYLAMLDRMGAATSGLGDSTGKLEDL